MAQYRSGCPWTCEAHQMAQLVLQYPRRSKVEVWRCGWTFESGYKHEHLFFFWHINIFQRASVPLDKLSIQVNRWVGNLMTANFCPQLTQYWQDGRYIYSPSNMNSFLPIFINNCQCWTDEMSTIERDIEPLIWHYHLKTWTVTLWQVDHIDHPD